MSESVSPVIEGMGEHIKRTIELLEKTDLEAVSALVDKLFEAYQAGTRVYICGTAARQPRPVISPKIWQRAPSKTRRSRSVFG